MSIINDNGLTGMKAFRKLMKDVKGNGVHTQNDNPNKNRLDVTYTRCNVFGEQVAPEGCIFYHANITLYDETGHPNTGTTLFHVNQVAEDQRGQKAIEEELNQICLTQMRAAVNLHRSNVK